MTKELTNAPPATGEIISNGRIDFLVHKATEKWVYGVAYPTSNRGNIRAIRAGEFELVKIAPGDWSDMEVKIMKEVQTCHFAQFKFRIGDVVSHVADERVDNARYVVVERHWVETPGGIERRYKLTGVGVGSFIAREIEMRSAQQSN